MFLGEPYYTDSVGKKPSTVLFKTLGFYLQKKQIGGDPWHDSHNLSG